MSSNPGGQQAAPPTGPPYLPQTAQIGGIPTPIPDIPVSAVLLALFVLAAAAHMALFQANRRRGHNFAFSAVLFGFCAARVVALALRIAWAAHPGDADLSLAAAVFTSAGVLLLFVVNLVLVVRVLRAWHPAFGWSAPVRGGFRALVASVAAVLVMVVTCSVHSLFTLDAAARQREREVQLFSGVYLTVMAFLPVVVVLAAGVVPRKEVQEFGTGKMRTKAGLLLFTSVLLTLGAGFRAGANFAPRPAASPAWYHSRAAYYCFNYVIELLVLYTYAISRFDLRFYVPDGSSARRTYSAVHREEQASKGAGGAGSEKEAEV
ncbi:hypothetical protein VTK56DRAFT_1527 [Thermocarpiscus australiensis]